MGKMKIGVIREEKIPVDRRVPFTPAQAREVMDRFNVELVVQESEVRAFSAEEYRQYDVPLVTKVDDCDVLFGVKEVPIDSLIPQKTYFFFSHTIKEQAYNRPLLQTILKKNIEMVDYECLTDTVTGQRIVAFGRYAGIVGAYNGIWTYGKRYNLFDLKRAYQCYDMEEMQKEYVKVKLPPIKIAITGGGRVARGAMEVLHGMGIRKVSPHELLTELFNEPVFAQLNSRDYHLHKEGKVFERNEFHQNPDRFQSDFLPYARVTDLLIACAYWNPKAPVLFKREDMLQRDFKIKVIADITCDIEGSIPSTKMPSTIEDPIFDYDAEKDETATALSSESHVTVMAVDNLPCELPRNASEDFGRELIDNVLPHLLEKVDTNVIHRATIAKDGKLTENFQYLSNYVAGH